MDKKKEYTLAPIQLDTYRSLREVVSDALRQAIKDGRLSPGQRLREITLADTLGVSRTPIREAIRQLEQEGFVVMVPRRGTYVADISLKDIAQVFEIRGALEELAAGLAAERITTEELECLERILVEINGYIERDEFERIVDADVRFHDVLYHASRNQRLVDILHNLREQMLRFRSISMHYPGRLTATWEEHRQMVENIAAHNSSMARKVAKRHMENSEKTLLKGIREDKKSLQQWKKWYHDAIKE
ncbi:MULTISPECIES: GntR family transcriptional regulator [Megasphaera]|uniref:FCD domain protein n=1 Tax=Megasphaera hutchinsoni TaxID=1588748 RepID=A0A134CDH3_9FIRM|nr:MULTISPECIES: GntR family transcriptional regulator [Megasphaera]EGS33292.1 FCD domain protein [Megasphaera sp. UPII 135-E]KXB90174.1 FCD domain protein [Megasphaera hutchinsoni]MUP47794.1 GntR family transcriptional regulator [Veillonellaceae bacterium M2-8]PNH22154.1 GntR family transcriptional regulator [Megasphaera genomosp. type_2]